MNKPDLALSAINAAPLLLAALYAILAVPVLREQALPLTILIVSAPLAATLIALSVVDLRCWRLPDILTLPLIAAGPLLAFALEWDSVPWRVGSAAAGFLVLFAVAYGYRAIRGRTGLGLGDAKLFGAAGAWLGMESLPSVMLWACGGALLGVLLAFLLRQPVEASSRIPFGPFLALGFWIAWLYGPVT